LYREMGFGPILSFPLLRILLETVGDSWHTSAIIARVSCI